MNETLYDLEQKRKAVEQDIQALYETLQKEISEQKKIWEILFSLISFLSIRHIGIGLLVVLCIIVFYGK